MDAQKLCYNDMGLKNDCEGVSNRHVQWVFMESGNGVFDVDFNGSTCDEDSILSSSSSSSDIEENDSATSPSTSSSSSNSGPLYELSQLMEHLPIKRGLSSFFKGKSQSFTSLASVRSVEDLAKKETPCRKKDKSCSNKYKPKAIITKKSCARSSKGSNFISLVGKRGTFVSTNTCRPSISVVQKHFNM